MMPELPGLTVYREALEARIAGQPLEAVRLGSPFLLRSVEPKLEETFGRRVAAFDFPAGTLTLTEAGSQRRACMPRWCM